jgi:hypothetical protein
LPGGNVAVAHAGLDCRERSAHGAVLHDGGAPHEVLLLRAFDHLDAIDKVGSVDKLGVGEAPLLHVVDHRERHLVGADEADGAAGVWRKRLRSELRIVGRGVIAG